jgi:hypothetical protein
MFRWGLVVVLLAVAPPASGRPRLAVPGWLWRADGQALASTTLASPADSWMNRGNQVLAVPQATWATEVRLTARVQAGPRWQLVLRPSVAVSAQAVAVQGRPIRWPRHADLEWPEAYLYWGPTDALSITCGRQNFQWGPAELLSPSNRLFREVGAFRDASYAVRGRDLLRVNLSRGRQWSLVGLADVHDTGAPPWRAGVAFRPAALAKLEYVGFGGDAYLGLTGGARRGDARWIGAYGTAPIMAGVSAYGDAALQWQGRAWYPLATDRGGIAFAAPAGAGLGEPRLLGLVGLRYTAVAAVDARIEYLRQSAGYTRTQLSAAPLAVAQAPTPANVARWLAPGLELLGRHLAMVSVLTRELGPKERLTLHGRYLRSFTDRSGVVVANAALDLGSAWVAYGSLAAAHGDELAEFTRLTRVGGVAGLIWSW